MNETNGRVLLPAVVVIDGDGIDRWFPSTTALLDGEPHETVIDGVESTQPVR